jgi:hypothetical protein
MTVPDCQTAGETSTAKPTKKANATAVARISRKPLLVMRASLYELALRKLLAFRTRTLIWINPEGRASEDVDKNA